MNQWTSHAAEYETALQRIQAVARDQGLSLNPDAKRIEKVVGLMTENFVKAGAYYCPCKQSHPLNPEADTPCPCPEWKEEIAQDGHCFCRLFYGNTGNAS
jgi:ferredoxin-thioredoxin reductase catalytic subunit